MFKPKRYFSLIGIVIVLCLFVGCIGSNSPNDKGYKLTVSVKDSKTGYALAGAKVEVVGKNFSDQISDAKGKVSFSNISGLVEIRVSLSGYKTKTESFTVSNDESVDVKLTLDPSNGEKTEIAGSRFATVSKQEGFGGPYFDFSSGQASKTGGDIKITSVSFGTEHTMIGFENCNGVKFSVSKPDDYAVEEALEKFRTLDIADWEPSDPTDKKIQVEPYDTLLLKTDEGRYVKLYILETRGHFNHDDRPAIDFAYIFLDEADNSKPVLQSITVIMEDGCEVTRDDLEGIVEIELSGDPEGIRFNFNEVVFSNRPLQRIDAGFEMSHHPIWFNPEHHYLCNPYLATSFEGPVWVSSMTPPWSSLEVKVGDEQFYEKVTENQAEISSYIDLGYLYSDLFGNQITELPFEKIVLKKVD